MFWWPEVKHQHLLFNGWVVHALLALSICYAIVDNYVLLFLACYGVPRKYFVVFRIIDISDLRSNDDSNEPNFFCVHNPYTLRIILFFTRVCALIREKVMGYPIFRTCWPILTSVGQTVVGVSIIFFVLFVEASAVILCKFQPNRSTFEYEFEYEYECVANFMDISG